MEHFFYFKNKLRHRVRHACLHVDVAPGKRRPKSPKCLMLGVDNSIYLCLLEFCFSTCIFVVSCSSLSEVRQCPNQLCPALYHWASCSFTRTLHYSTLSFTYVEDQQLFHYAAKKLVRYIWIYQRFRASKFPSCNTLVWISLGYRDRIVKKKLLEVWVLPE